MVVKYNNKTALIPKKTATNFSHRSTVNKLSPANIKFLQVLGFKLKDGHLERHRKSYRG